MFISLAKWRFILHPSVPFYNLPRLHRLLQRVEYSRKHGYGAAFADSLRKLVRT